MLDTSALLAFAFEEPGADRVDEILDDALISSVNAAEVATKLTERESPEEEAQIVWALVEGIVRPFSIAQAWSCGVLRRQTHQAGLSLGDRACLALAMEVGGVVVTADRAWAELKLDLDIKLIR